jgi:glycosyltransferase involved in cell wall biosynthesis
MKKKILIGPMNDGNVGSIPSLNRAFVDGLKEDFEFVPFNIFRKYGKSKVSRLNIINIYYFIKQYFTLIALVIRHKPFIFHYPMNSGWSLEKSLFFLNTAKLFGAKKVLGHLHGGAFNVFMDNLGSARKKVALMLFSNVDTVIVASRFWKEYLLKIGIKTPAEIVNNPIDSKFVARINEMPKKSRNDRFLFIGALGKRKGVYDIIASSKKGEVDFKVDLIGAEDRANDLKRIKGLIDKNQLGMSINLIISEKLDLDDKAKYFTENQVFLFPTYNENFPLVIIEAACAGIPIISTPVGALPEFFSHMENIYFVEPGNVDEIEEAIKFMQSNPFERERLGRAARNTYETKLSGEIVMNQLKRVYKAY